MKHIADLVKAEMQRLMNLKIDLKRTDQMFIDRHPVSDRNDKNREEAHECPR